MTITQKLTDFHREASTHYKAGCRDPQAILSPENLADLTSLGLSAQFLYDCVDDLSRYGEPSLETFVALAQIRTNYFKDVLKGRHAAGEIPESNLPPKSAEFQGVAWLPRIIEKARCFLAGSLCADIMYGCAGDRKFLSTYGPTLPSFLETVRDSQGDPHAALRCLEKSRSLIHS
jgi:hypothetical protein